MMGIYLLLEDDMTFPRKFWERKKSAKFNSLVYYWNRSR